MLLLTPLWNFDYHMKKSELFCDVTPGLYRLVTGRYVLGVLYEENWPNSENWATLTPRSSATVRHAETLTELGKFLPLGLQRGVNSISLQCILWPVACSEWGACFDRYSISDFGGKRPLKWKFSKISGFIDGIPRYVSWPNLVKIGRCEVDKKSHVFTHSLTAALDQLRVVASSTSNDPGPRSRQHQQIGRMDYHTQKKLALHRTRPSPHFAQNGPIASKIPWTLSTFDMSTYTEFGPDQLRFAGLILERLIFRPKKSIQYWLSAYNEMHKISEVKRQQQVKK